MYSLIDLMRGFDNVMYCTTIGAMFLCILLDYLCVPRTRRGGGIGGRLLALMREKYPADTVFLGESEAPGGDPAADPELVKHAEWAAQLREKHSFTAKSVEEILRQEIGLVFARVLDHAGVFKCTPAGRDAFLRFVGAVR